MNVVQVNYRFDERLSEPEELLDRYTTLTGWSDALVGAGAEVSVVQRFHRDATVIRGGVRYEFRSSDVRGAVLRQRADIVHFNGLDSPGPLARLALTLAAGTGLVVQDHGSRVPNGNPGGLPRVGRQLLRKRAMRTADAFLFTAAEAANEWRAAGLIGSEQSVYQVLEASTTIRPTPRIDARADSGVRGAPAVLWVGRLDDNKDPMTVLDGFEQALVRLPGAVLTMVYNAEALLTRVRARIAASKALAARVRLAGHVPHESIVNFYSGADVFVLGSHHEGSGYALIESIACGAAPAVTSIPTFRVITGNGAIGALWVPGDAASCATAIEQAAGGDPASARTRTAEHFASHLSWAVVGRQAVAAYAEVISRARSAR
jgi:glycosyltransferase involved in cell wall biosynthesis